MTDTKKSAGTAKTTTTRKTTAKKPAAKTSATKSTTAKRAPAKKSTKATTKAQETVTINGKQYALESLNDNARAQLTNIRATDKLIEELQLELAIAKTARIGYSKELEKELEAMNATLQ